MIAAFVIALMLLAAPAWAACSGSSPNWTCVWGDIQALHDGSLQNGDTITVSTGSYTVTSATTITKHVTLIASGTVTITWNFNTDYLLKITESTVGNTRVEGFTWERGASAGLTPYAFILVSNTSGGKPVLITGNTFAPGSAGNSIYFTTNRGVVWNNTATGTVSGGGCNNNASFVRIKADSLTTSWTTAATYGAADTNGDGQVYIEGNTWSKLLEGVDCDGNCRAVIRYNTIDRSGITMHGGTSAIMARYADIHHNTFQWSNTVECAPDLDVGMTSFIGARAGTMLIHDNTIPDIGASLSAWGNKPEIVFLVEILKRDTQTFGCWGSGTAGTYGDWGSGTYPAPYQVGWGYTSGGTTPTGQSFQQDSEPVYIWDNTGAGAYNSPALQEYDCGSGDACAACATTCQLVTTFLQSGRDWITGTAKPGYSAFTCPHPLASGSYCSVSGTSTVAPRGRPRWHGPHAKPDRRENP